MQPRGFSLNVLTRESHHNAGILGCESSDTNIQLDKIKPKARGSQTWCYVFSNRHCRQLVVEGEGEGDHFELIWKYTGGKSINVINMIGKVSIQICI